MMIAKTISRSNVRGCLKYVFDDEKGERDKEGNTVQRGELVGGNMAGQSIEDLQREFDAVTGLKPNIKKPVTHHVLTFSPEDQQKLSMPQMVKIAEDYMKQRGYENSMYVSIAHRDTENIHLHIVASKIDLKGKVISEWRSKRKDFACCRDLEKKYGLRELADKPRAIRKQPTRNEAAYKDRTGRLTVKEEIQREIANLVVNKVFPDTSLNKFTNILQAQGISVRTRINKEGNIAGMSFAKQSEKGKVIAFKGSDLGIAYNWKNLKKFMESIVPAKEEAHYPKTTEVTTKSFGDYSKKVIKEKLIADHVLTLFKESAKNQSVKVSHQAWKTFEKDLTENFVHQNPTENQIKLIQKWQPDHSAIKNEHQETTRLEAVQTLLDIADEKQHAEITKNTIEHYEHQVKETIQKKEMEKHNYEKDRIFNR